MNKLFFLFILCVSSASFSQIPGQSQITGPQQGTVKRQWLANTTTAWETANRYFTIKPGESINWSDTVNVEQVQTNYFAQEVVTRPEQKVWEKTGSYTVNEQDPFCINQQNLLPPEQRQACPLLPTSKDVYGWVSYPEQTGQQDGGTQRTVVRTQPIQVSVRLSGQVLLDYETEQLDFSVDRNAQISASVSGSLNKYLISAEPTSNHSATVVAQGLGRNLSPEDGAILSDVLFAPDRSPVIAQAPDQPSKIFVKFQLDDRLFAGGVDPAAQLKVTYELLQTDGASSYDSSYRTRGARTLTLDPKSQHYFEIDLYGAGRGRNTKAKLYFNLIGSKWYSERTFTAETQGRLVK